MRNVCWKCDNMCIGRTQKKIS